MSNWNFADIWEVVADELPDASASSTATSAARGARSTVAPTASPHLLDAGLERQQAVAQYLYNGPEYMESMFAAFKGAFVPVNTNYRYTADELLYLWDNADAGCVVFHGTFADTIEPIRARLPKVKVVVVGRRRQRAVPRLGRPPTSRSPPRRPSGSFPSGVAPATTSTCSTPAERPACRRASCGARTTSPSTLTRVARQPAQRGRTVDDIRGTFTEPGPAFLPGLPPDARHRQLPVSVDALRRRVRRHPDNRTFDPVELLDTIEREGVNSIAMVGDAFGKPILRTLDEHPGRWDLSTPRSGSCRRA